MAFFRQACGPGGEVRGRPTPRYRYAARRGSRPAGSIISAAGRRRVGFQCGQEASPGLSEGWSQGRRCVPQISHWREMKCASRPFSSVKSGAFDHEESHKARRSKDLLFLAISRSRQSRPADRCSLASASRASFSARISAKRAASSRFSISSAAARRGPGEASQAHAQAPLDCVFAAFRTGLSISSTSTSISPAPRA